MESDTALSLYQSSCDDSNVPAHVNGSFLLMLNAWRQERRRSSELAADNLKTHAQVNSLNLQVCGLARLLQGEQRRCQKVHSEIKRLLSYAGSMTEERDALLQEKENLSNEIVTFMRAMEILEEKGGVLQEAYECGDKLCRALEGDLMDERTTIRNLREEIALKNEQLAQSELRLGEKEVFIRSIEKKVKKLNDSLDDDYRYTENIDREKKMAIKSLTKLFDSHTSLTQQMEAASAYQSSLEENVASLEMQLKQGSEKTEAASAYQSSLEENVASLEMQLKQGSEKTEAASAYQSSLEESVASLEMQLKQGSEKTEAASAYQSSLEENVASLEMQLKQGAEVAEALRQAVAAKDREIAELTARLATLDANMSEPWMQVMRSVVAVAMQMPVYIFRFLTHAGSYE